jgi:hypothetical protein
VLDVLAAQADAVRRGDRPASQAELAERLYAALTGQPPASAHDSVRLARADVPPALAALIDHARAETTAGSRPPDRQWLAEVAAAVGLGAASAARAEPSRGVRARRQAARAVLVSSVVALVVAAVLLMRPPLDANEVEPPLGLSAERAMLLHGLTEQADAMLRRDDFPASTAAYQRYGDLVSGVGGAAMLHGWTDTRLAFVRHLATDYTGSEAYAASAIGRLDRSGVGDHPWRVTALAMLGTALGQRGSFEDAAHALASAVAMRGRLLGLPATKVSAATLVTALERVPADAEWDEDGLLNVFESLLGFDPRQPDTDRDGIGDADELNAHGWPHVVAFGLSQDATRVLGTAGGRRPEESGFWRAGTGTVRAVGTGWAAGLELASSSQLLFHAPFSSEQKRAAPLQGWRLFLRFRVERGRIVAVVNAMPTLGPCRLTARREGDALQVSLNGTEARLAADGPGGLVLLEMFYEPSTRTVQLRQQNSRVMAQPVAAGAGVSPWGLTFGVESDGEDASATVAAVLFEIRF